MSVVTKEEVTETGGKREASNGKDGVVSNSGGGSMQNQVGNVMLFGIPIVSLVMDGKERLCLAQISSTLLKDFSYNEIHNRRVALGINCVQCTPVQLEILRRAGAMPVTSRRCGMITRREAERLCKSFLGDHAPPQLPENFAFDVYHECGWGCRGSFVPSRYNSSRAKCIRCSFCQLFFSPNKFIFHSHRLPESRYVQPDAANFNSWRRHMKLCGDPPEEANSTTTISDVATAQIVHAWEDVKAMFNGGTRKRLLAASVAPSTSSSGRHGGSGLSSGKGAGSSTKSSSQNHHHSSHHSHHHHSGENHSKGGGGGGGVNSGNHTKKDQTTSGSVSSSSGVNAPSSHHQPLGVLPSPVPYSGNPDQAHLQTSPSFLHQAAAAAQHHPFLNVPNPLISPGGRLADAIWNPALQASAARQCPPPFPTLPFHPLSIPWLRRPLFPFSHPFGPNLVGADQSSSGSDGSPTEKLSSTSSRQSQSSAFKPVSRNPVEPLFNWLNGNGFGIHAPPPSTSLPEDLSLHSSTPPGATSALAPNSSSNLLLLGSTPSTEKGHHRNTSSSNNNNNNVKHSSHSHQVQILSAASQNESDSEENVDIESTVETEECSSTTSSVWVSSTTAALGGRTCGGSTTPIHNNNNNTTINNNKRKRTTTKTSSLPPVVRSTSPQQCYSSGEEDDGPEISNNPQAIHVIDDRDHEDELEDDDNSSIDNHEESYDAKIPSPSSSSSPPHNHHHSYPISRTKSSARKRLWVNEIISTTDEDDEGGRHQQIMLVNSIPKGSSSSNNSNNSKRSKLNFNQQQQNSHNNHSSHLHQHHHHRHHHSNSAGSVRFILESPE